MSPVFLYRTKTKIVTFGKQSAVGSHQSTIGSSQLAWLK